jgi:hypothetical protein
MECCKPISLTIAEPLSQLKTTSFHLLGPLISRHTRTLHRQKNSQHRDNRSRVGCHTHCNSSQLLLPCSTLGWPSVIE